MKEKNLKIKYMRICLDGSMQSKTIDEFVFDVLGSNKERLVIDDSYFTTLKKEKSKRAYATEACVGEIHISDYTTDSYFREYWGHLVITVYYFGISRKILQNRINKSVNSYIDKKIGRYLAFAKCNIKL